MKKTIIFLMLSLFSVAFGEPTENVDLELKNVQCVLAWEDEETKNNFSYGDKLIELESPIREDYETHSAWWSKQKEYQDKREKLEYILYKVNGETFAYKNFAPRENIDLNKNDIHDWMENKEYGVVVYNCEFEIENIGEDLVVTEDTYDYIKMRVDYKYNDDYIDSYLNMSFYDKYKDLKSGESFKTKVNNALVFRPSGVPSPIGQLVFKDNIDIRFGLNVNPVVSHIPVYAEASFGQQIYDLGGNLFSSRELLKENNKSNNYKLINLELPKGNYLDFAKNVEFSANEETEEFEVNWDAVEGAESYEVRMVYYYDNNINLNGQIKLESLPSDQTSFKIDYEGLTVKDKIGVNILAHNENGSSSSATTYVERPLNYFKDVKKGSWYEKGVNLAYRWGAIKGYSDKFGNPTYEFMPDKNVTKAEAIAIMMFMNNLDQNHKPLVPAEYQNKWYAYLLNYLIEKNFSIIENGYNLNEEISRAELIKFIIEKTYINTQSKKDKFESAEFDKYFEYSFDDILDHPLRKYIQFGYDMNIINGMGDGTFKPDDTLNRAQAVKILENFKNKQVREIY